MRAKCHVSPTLLGRQIHRHRSAKFAQFCAISLAILAVVLCEENKPNEKGPIPPPARVIRRFGDREAEKTISSNTSIPVNRLRRQQVGYSAYGRQPPAAPSAPPVTQPEYLPNPSPVSSSSDAFAPSFWPSQGNTQFNTPSPTAPTRHIISANNAHPSAPSSHSSALVNFHPPASQPPHRDTADGPNYPPPNNVIANIVPPRATAYYSTQRPIQRNSTPRPPGSAVTARRGNRGRGRAPNGNRVINNAAKVDGGNTAGGDGEQQQTHTGNAAEGTFSSLAGVQRPSTSNKVQPAPSAEPAHRYYYPPRMPLPLPTCFHNPTGYACCNPMLNDLMVETYTELEAKPRFHTCNINAIATMLQQKAEQRFNTSFETIAAFDDFAQKIHFHGDLVCKVELGGKYMLAYGSIRDVARSLSPTPEDETSGFQANTTPGSRSKRSLQERMLIGPRPELPLNHISRRYTMWI
ncbi:ground-like domain-containing protein [Ditylenchus destructor]|uniref:Ground-like domain-containing protein n=1 Tax=Ditylenchus destructor TaxID=166010 RepID=A0AAD4R529_9BILA|nr:ground-like domain-containing protein [Ditylenchus destructor]